MSKKIPFLIYKNYGINAYVCIRITVVLCAVLQANKQETIYHEVSRHPTTKARHGSMSIHGEPRSVVDYCAFLANRGWYMTPEWDKTEWAQ